MKKIFRKIERAFAKILIKFLPMFGARYGSGVSMFFYKRWGMKFTGQPQYLSALINFDGTDYSLIEIGEGVTMSSYIRVLTHDWSLYTVAKSVGYFSDKPIGKIYGVKIGDYSFVGTGSIVMPGTVIGKGCIIGSGTVVRGKIPDYSIVVGSPGEIVGDTRDFIKNQMTFLNIENSEWHNILETNDYYQNN